MSRSSQAFDRWRDHMAHVRSLDGRVAGECLGFIIMSRLAPVAFSLRTGWCRFETFLNDNEFTIPCR